VVLLGACVTLACAQWYDDAPAVYPYEQDYSDYQVGYNSYPAVSPYQRAPRGGGNGGFWYYYGPERGHGWGKSMNFHTFNVPIDFLSF